jgi:hypothetical protein
MAMVLLSLSLQLEPRVLRSEHPSRSVLVEFAGPQLASGSAVSLEVALVPGRAESELPPVQLAAFEPTRLVRASAATPARPAPAVLERRKRYPQSG